jgi:RNA polymerase sigma factor (sigma-70 family)
MRRLSETLEAPPECSPEELLRELERRQLLNSALAQLDPDSALVVRRRYRDGVPFRAIAGELDLAVSSVHARHTRAITALRVIFDGLKIKSLSEV